MPLWQVRRVDHQPRLRRRRLRVDGHVQRRGSLVAEAIGDSQFQRCGAGHADRWRATLKRDAQLQGVRVEPGRYGLAAQFQADAATVHTGQPIADLGDGGR